jgi:hypothetical protein
MQMLLEVKNLFLRKKSECFCATKQLSKQYATGVEVRLRRSWLQH